MNEISCVCRWRNRRSPPGGFAPAVSLGCNPMVRRFRPGSYRIPVSKSLFQRLRSGACAAFAVHFLTSWLAAQPLPENFVHVEDVVPGLVTDLRYSAANNFVGERIDGYLTDKPVLTREAAEALKAVQADLNRFGLGLKVFDAYRPRRAVLKFVEWAKDLNDLETRTVYYPNVPKNELFAREYIADHSSHSRGSTVDVTIVALSEKQPPRELDMGTEFDFFDELSWPENLAPSAQQRANRALLRFVMQKHGFKTYEQEWWHFTLKNEPFPDSEFDFPVE
jgi:D-alanyl-D-alanine dipeptidase